MIADPPPEWMKRSALALQALLADTQLWDRVNEAVDAFFKAHPDEPRTQQSLGLMTVLVFERLTRGQGNPDNQTERTAC